MNRLKIWPTGGTTWKIGDCQSYQDLTAGDNKLTCLLLKAQKQMVNYCCKGTTSQFILVWVNRIYHIESRNIDTQTETYLEGKKILFDRQGSAASACQCLLQFSKSLMPDTLVEMCQPLRCASLPALLSWSCSGEMGSCALFNYCSLFWHGLRPRHVT